MKICVPMTGSDIAALTKEAAAVRQAGCDLAEWRADWYEGPPFGAAAWAADESGGAGEAGGGRRPDGEAAALAAPLAAVKRALGPTPLLFTFRTAAEGGRRALGPAAYRALLRAAAATGLPDAVDVELFTAGDPAAPATLPALIDDLHAAGVKVLLSSHDFEKTPPAKEMESRLRTMERLGADIVKLAVMPRSEADVEALLQITRRIKAAGCRPALITVAMGELGVKSRLAGGPLGSDYTFGVLDRPSAPGQLAVAQILRAWKGGGKER